MSAVPSIEPESRRIEARLDWIRWVESMSAERARRELRARMRDDARMAGQRVPRLDEWPTMPDIARKMYTSDAELVRLDTILEMLDVGDRILDVGCGPGVVAGTLALGKPPAAYLGIDLAPAKIATARDMAATNGFDDLLHFATGDAAELPTDDIERLDPSVVLILEVLEHLQEPHDVLSSIVELVPDRARIVFSVPLLGRLEACWGHRTLYGADAIIGLAEACNVHVHDVREVHNTWVVAAVSRSHATVEQTHPRPVPIRHVLPKSLRVEGGELETVPAPQRSRLTIPAGGTAVVSMDAEDATWARVDLEIDDHATCSDLQIRLHDLAGTPLVSWTAPLHSLDRRRTLVFRPHEADRRIDGRTATMAIEIRALRSAPCNLTLWRVGYSTDYHYRGATRPSVTIGESPIQGHPAGGDRGTGQSRWSRSTALIERTGRRVARRLEARGGVAATATGRIKGLLRRARSELARHRDSTPR